uniref:Uncharacterized protein n=1 Tax=Aegilops tauschii subsp. strangulata TaxID=200361 RepID=A0A453FWG4_AEGTS
DLRHPPHQAGDVRPEAVAGAVQGAAAPGAPPDARPPQRGPGVPEGPGRHPADGHLPTHRRERSFNWGLTVKGKSERVLKLLERGPFLEEERERARKVAREIKGFGSFNLSSGGGGSRAAPHVYGRSHSRYEDRPWKEEDGEGEDKENLVSRPDPRS